jgi:methylamine dehydrogenase accessory protein MauD
MSAGWLVSYLLLWALVLFLGFLLLGALRGQALLRWRLEQMELTTPRRTGRDGLRIGAKAPDFSLPAVSGGQVGLNDFAGARLLLVFLHAGCKPCEKIVPELNRLHEAGGTKVLAVSGGTPEAVAQFAARTGARFPMVTQDRHEVSHRYQVYATPFGFLINEKGLIASKGVVSGKQYLQFVLSNARPELVPGAAKPQAGGPAEEASSDSVALTNTGGLP